MKVLKKSVFKINLEVLIVLVKDCIKQTTQKPYNDYILISKLGHVLFT